MAKSIRSKIKRKWRTKRVNDSKPETAKVIDENYEKLMAEIAIKKKNKKRNKWMLII